MTPEEKLRAHSAEFEKTIYKLASNMHIAVGYAASNVGMIEGNDGLIIIDTTESTKAAENILAEFRKLTDKPVKTIIYTHSHRDHISGATVFSEGRDVEIIAHHGFHSDLVAGDTKPGPHAALLARTKRQFGIGLEQGSERINIGLGPGDRPLEGLGQGHLPPTTLVEEDGQTIERYGVSLHLAFAPGECHDNLIVHLPQEKVLFSADNYYTGFPNLYAIRGTPYREFDLWADSLAKLRSYEAEVLAPGHSKPVYGADQIAARLTDYEEAIRFIVTQSAEGMNRGLTVDDLVEYVQLPPHLAEKPFLQEFYGTVAWSVRAYFTGTLGWFDGDAASLFPLPRKDEAKRFIELIGGPEKVLEAATVAMRDGDFQWALQLVARQLALHPNHTHAAELRIKTLRLLAQQQSNACARNYYLLTAKEEETALDN